MKLTRDLLVAIMELPFMMFHASMVLFLCVRRRKDPLICSAFFTIYIIVSMADMTTIIVTNILIVLMNAGIHTDAFLACALCPKLQVEAHNYCRMVQAIGHTAIALNRFSCFYADPGLESIWKGRKGTLICVAIPVLSLPILIVNLPHGVVYMGFGVDLYGGQYSDSAWAKTSMVIYAMVFSVLAIVSFAASWAAAHQLYRRRLKLNVARNSDARLLVHSTIMLVFQVLMTLMYLTYSGVITWSVVRTIVEWRYYGDMYCLTAPIFLLLLSEHVRRKYLEFYGLKNSFSTGPVTMMS